MCLASFRAAGKCVCKQPCDQKLYVPSLSFSSITVNNDKLSRTEQKEMEKLQKNLAVAREITYR